MRSEEEGDGVEREGVGVAYERLLLITVNKHIGGRGHTQGCEGKQSVKGCWDDERDGEENIRREEKQE